MMKSPRSPAVSSWPTRIISAAVLGIAGTSAMLAAGTAQGDSAQSQPIVNERFNDFAPAIEMLRQVSGQYRRDVVSANMLLTDSESSRFWPLYDQYRAERQKIGDRKVRLITDFLAQRNSMSEDQAGALAKDSFAIDKDLVELKDKWYRKMTKVLSERTVARFFQLDQDLDAASDMALASNLPLMR